jgi:leader peptidase (prepilin peptidase) / N-methyltransferase
MSSLFELLAVSPGFFVGTCLVLGLVIGSFLNVVIYRLPIMLEREWRAESLEILGGDPCASPGTPASPPRAPFNLVVPRSACPACKAPITALQNIPVLSYLFLRGRCASCGVRITPRYPAIEALTGVLSAAVAWKFGFGAPALAALVLTWFLITLAFIDIDTQFLPDTLTLPLLWLGLLLSLWAPLEPGAPIPQVPREAIIGALAGYLSLWSVYHLFRLVTGKEGMGYGDFKLFAACGAWLGWKMLLPLVLFAAAVGAVVGIAILALRRDERIAFGPFLAAGGWLMLMFGQEVLTVYWNWTSPTP